ncbi:hypothetical protein PPS11_15306 [Pseudomonas putida S11]|nr:hypothetical protein PPS11_15306 [Pseudomonas putida S11]
MSGSETISSSGVPARFRSMPVEPLKSSCRLLPASSSRCARVYPDALDGAVFQGDIQVALADDRQVHLADLVALGQVRVEVVLAREHVALADLGIDGQAEHARHAHGFLVQYRQYARHAQVNQAGLGVRLGTEGGGAAGEDLRLGGELSVDFQPDHNFPLHV